MLNRKRQGLLLLLLVVLLLLLVVLLVCFRGTAHRGREPPGRLLRGRGPQAAGRGTRAMKN